MKKTLAEMTEEETRKLMKMHATTLMMLEEGHSEWYIAEKLGLQEWQVEWNIDEILRIIRKRIGLLRFIESIFIR